LLRVQRERVSVYPAVILKMMFLLFFDDIASERDLMRMIPERLDYMWFLGYGLDDAIPNHSVLSKARRRWGSKVFESLFVRTVIQCVQAGLVDGRKVHVDASLVDANASKDSVVQANVELIRAIRRVYEQEERKLDERGERMEAGDEGSGDDVVNEEEEGTDESGGESRDDGESKGLMSRTDPEAAVVRRGKGESRARYKNHRAVDDAYGVITATKTTSGDVDEGGEMMELVEGHEKNTSTEVETVVGDSKYGTVKNFRACEERGIESHMADLAATQKGTGRRRGIFGEEDFVYDASSDTYRCPAGQVLRRRRHKKTRCAYEYTAGAKVCAACELRGQCTRSKSGRSIKRHEDHDVIEAVRAKSRSAGAKRDRRRRKHLMEGSFADAANNHGFKRARWRGLVRQQIQDFVIAAVQNIRILLRHGWRWAMAQTHVSIKGICDAALNSLSDSFRALALVGECSCLSTSLERSRCC